MMKTTAKAASHTVTPSPAGFVVVSGTSGASYLVVPLSLGGAACNCAHGRHSSAIASRCSHVRAVEAFAARLALPADPFQGFRDEPAAKPMVRCWLCDGKGETEQHDDYQDRSGRWVSRPVRVETCINCGGKGETPKEA